MLISDMPVTAILLAAGKGERFKKGAEKVFALIHSQEAVAYSLKALNAHSAIKDIVVVGSIKNSERLAGLIKRYKINKACKIVKGGRRRQDSVCNGLKAVDDRADLVLIHDAARPFIDRGVISSVIKEAGRSGAAILAVPVKDTIKKAQSGLSVKETLDRSKLWMAQTPQVFRRELITEAYNKYRDSDVTDDASLVERMNHPVKIVEGSHLNIKITTFEDLVLAEAIIKMQTRNPKH